jgi:hypothetical protein
VSRAPQRRAALHADRPGTAYVIAGFVVVVMAVSMFISFYGLAAVGAWMGLPAAATWTLPVMLDGGIIAYTLSTYLRRAQGRSAVYPWVMVVLATLVSAAANAAHVIIAANGAVEPRVVVGAILAGLAPTWAAASAHQVGDLVAPGPAPARRSAPVSAPVLDAPAAPALTASAPRTPASASVRPVRSAPARTTTITAGVAVRQEALRLAQEGLSQRAIAEAVGASKSSVARWLTSEAIPV